MKILQINKFSYIVGGADRYFLEIPKLLINKKHDVNFFSMQPLLNQLDNFHKYFVTNITYGGNNFLNLYKILSRIFYSREARKNISKLLDECKLDIIHLHSIYHHISPSILLEFKKRNLPIVHTLHDYHLVSPNYNMFHNGKICEISKPNKFYLSLFHKCVKDSYIASFIEVTEKYFHYSLGWERNIVDFFIAPSLFMKNKLIEYGIIENKIIHLPYFVDTEKYQPKYSDQGYILYFGRLSPEKGLSFLINVMSKLPKIKLLVVGCGDEEYNLKIKVSKLRLSDIKFAGFKDGEELKSLIRNARFIVLPSLWYDVAPVSILESFASGKPVIASNIGGIPETVKDNYNGFLFEPGNVEDCLEKINRLWNNPKLCKKMGKNARHYVEINHNPSDHYEKLMEIYRRAIRMHR